MKRLIIFVLLAVLNSSCCTYFGIKRNIILVDSDKSQLKVTYNGQPEKIKSVTAFNSYSMLYKTNGITVKLKKDPIIELEQNGKTGSMVFETRAAWFWLIVPGLLTFGVSPLIDFATGAWRRGKNDFIDVPAVLNGEEPRSKRELINHMKENYEWR